MLSIISIVSINVSIINFEQINAAALKKLTLSLGVLIDHSYRNSLTR